MYENRNSFITSGGRQAALSRYILYPSMPHISFLSLAMNLNRSVFHATTFESSAEAYEGGSPPPWGGALSACISLPQAIYILHCIALHSITETIRLRKEIKYVLIHNNTLQTFFWSSIALNIHVSHFENWIFLFVVSLQKWLAHFLLQKRWRNEGFKGTLDMPLNKWRVTWNYACIPFKYKYIV